MAPLVYLLCALTSLGCALLLVRAYRRSRSPLLFWSALCFCGLFLNNALLITDLVLVPDVDLSLARSAVALASVLLLVHGLISVSGKGGRA
jgi:hypothetical protein